MTRRLLTAEGVSASAAEIIHVARRARLLVDELDRRARAAARDGYPSGGEGTRGGSTATPTEAAVIANDLHPCAQAADAATGHLHRARLELRAFEVLAADHGVRVDEIDGELVVRPPRETLTVKPPDEIWCRSHERFGMFVPRGVKGRRGLCSLCEGFEREHDDDAIVSIRRLTGSEWPSRELLDEVARVGKLTARVLADELGRARRAATGKKKRRKVRR